MTYSDTLEALSKAATASTDGLSPQSNEYWDIFDAASDAGGKLSDTLIDHSDDFVRLLRAAERKVTNDPRRCAELAEALAPFEEE